MAADIPKLRQLIDLSVRKLQTGDYSQAQIDNALKTVFGVDSQLIADGTYFVVEAEKTGGVESDFVESGATNILAGCGGWSKRRTLYGGDQWTSRHDTLLDPEQDAAKIRAFFIHPLWARRGLATLLLNACEAASQTAGFTRWEMGATLTGVKFFSARGYVPLETIRVAIGNGETLPVVHMEKHT